jgi:hypothetical protein
MKHFLSCLIGFYFCNACFAGVDFVENKNPIKQLNTLAKPPIKKIEFTTYNGHLEATLENDRYVTGNLFQNGKAIYVNGELVDGVFYLYDTQGKKYILNTKN